MITEDALYLNGYLMDLAGSETPAFTMQVNDLTELTDRQAVYSNKFKLLKSLQNIQALESCHIITRKTKVPYRKVSARYIKNGKEIVPTGFAKVESSGEFYEVTIYSGNANFFELIKDKLLSEIYWADLNHVFNLANAVASTANVDGIMYPPVAFTDDAAYISNANSIIDIRKSFPFVNCYTVVERIIKEAGFNIASNSYFNAGKMFRNFWMQLANEKFDVSGIILSAQPLNHVPTTYVSPGMTSHQLLGMFDDYTGDPVLRSGAFDIGGNFDGELFTLANDVSVPNEFELKVQIECGCVSVSAFDTGYDWWDVQLWYKDPSSVDHLLQSFSTPWRPANQFTHSLFNFNLPAGSYQAGGTFRVLAFNHNGNGGNPQQFFLFGNSYWYAETKVPVPIVFGDPVDVALHMPNMKCIDFIKGFAQIACLTTNTDADKLEINATPFYEIVANKTRAADWSNKIDLQQEPEIEFSFGNYGQKNWMRWKEDELVTAEYGDYYFLIDNETLPKQVEILKLPWAATEDLTLLEGRKIPFINRHDATGNRRKTTVRLLFEAGNLYPGAAHNIQYKDGTTTTTITQKNFIFINTLSSDHMGWARLLEIFYSDLILALDEAKKINQYFKLTPLDIENFDSTVPVYVQKFNSYLYLNKIKDWKGNGKSTKVELIRI